MTMVDRPPELTDTNNGSFSITAEPPSSTDGITEPAVPLDSLHALAAENAEMPYPRRRRLHAVELVPRAFATAIDGFIFGAVLALAMTMAAQVWEHLGRDWKTVPTVLWWLLALADVVFGGTPGKHAMSLSIRHVDGRLASRRQLMLRMLYRRPLLVAVTLTVLMEKVVAALAPTTVPIDPNPEMLFLCFVLQAVVYLSGFNGVGLHEHLSGTRLYDRSELTLALAAGNGAISGEAEGHAFAVITPAPVDEIDVSLAHDPGSHRPD